MPMPHKALIASLHWAPFFFPAGGVIVKPFKAPVDVHPEDKPQLPKRVSKVNRLAIEEAHRTGMLPHEFLLKISRGGRIDGKKPDLAMRISCAKAAAPYYAPKLSAVELIKDLNDEELEAIIAGTANEAGFTLSKK